MGTVALCLGLLASSECSAQDVLNLVGGGPRIYFEDNNSSSYVWWMFANDSGFEIQDGVEFTTPFRIAPNARTNSVFIGADGVGFGTDNPLRELHVVGGNAPILRLEQDTSGGYPAKTWEVEANDLNFMIHDVDLNKRPFKIQTGAPNNTLYLATSGNVGLGTTVPTTLLHAQRLAGSTVAETIARFDVSDDAIGKLEISNVSTTNGIFHPRIRGTTSSQAVAITMEGSITTDVGSNPIVSFAATKLAGGSIVNRPLVVFRNNQTIRATVAANGDIFATSFNPTSSRTMKDKILDLDSQKAQDALRQLVPVEYVYKDDPTSEQRVGFIAEDVPEIVANADRKSVPIMDVVALLTRVVKDQQQTIEEQKQSNDEQKQLNDRLLLRLDALEAQMKERN